MSKQINSYPVRFPEEVRTYLEQQAEKNLRSLHSEILTRITRTIEQDQAITGLSMDENTSTNLAELLKAIRQDQAVLINLLKSKEFAQQLIRQGFAQLAE
ncbi:Arc family DNA-binding protein [Endozoicomonas sp. YOMI1]|uniref:Arc family DNA-binding protein n=1 Tax=Endozoicomonas sp. YOMI1 TaxID=2828739 RepID=UPI00214959B4|nr:Arc family DNA-binding protein [Endozoicomonas sp. YOMI1]